jgi:hypothetical protein
MTTTELLQRLRESGVTVTVEGGHLRVAPKAALTPTLRRAITSHAGLLAATLSPPADDNIAWRAAAMRAQLPLRGPLPFLVARADVLRQDAPGQCLSCGDALASGQRYRCVPCVRAVEQVLHERRDG